MSEERTYVIDCGCRKCKWYEKRFISSCNLLTVKLNKKGECESKER